MFSKTVVTQDDKKVKFTGNEFFWTDVQKDDEDVEFIRLYLDDDKLGTFSTMDEVFCAVKSVCDCNADILYIGGNKA